MKTLAASLFKYVWPFSGHQALKGFFENFINLQSKVNKHRNNIGKWDQTKQKTKK